MVNNGPLLYYVNDGSTLGDVYSTDIGKPFPQHTGLKPDEPVDSIMGILTNNILEPEDIVFVDTGVYFRGTGSTAEVWQAVIDGADPSTLDDVRAADLAAFVAAAAESGLVRPRATEGTATFPDWAVGSLSLESHHDLQDLLALDPVHDVDSATGWPATAT